MNGNVKERRLFGPAFVIRDWGLAIIRYDARGWAWS